MHKLLATVAILAGLAATQASAATITFGGLPGSNGSTFTTYTEAGFTVAPTLGNVFEGHQFGNPAPSIVVGPVFGGSPTAAITITGGTFTFDALDYSANNGNLNYGFVGSLDGTEVLNLSGSLSGGFSTFNSGSAITLDTLVLTVTANGSSLNLDNIVLSTVVETPEPASLALLGVGLVGLAARRRRA